ncbi:DUF2142 domain-containing protein [Microbacterium sp. Root61]|uniref:DUF2142 domain-containing protein n=1 Tax=Microbacterium sp. Root61 TaxID=1736570 RepID=UPI0009E9861C|nr:DUF2142 domain-containing protein [Microbacterium sp. Root61]
MSRRRYTRIIPAVLVPLAMLIALLAWGVSSPPGSGPDDDYHMASIWCAGGDVEGRCEATSSPDYMMLPGEIVKGSKCFAFYPEQSASCPLPDRMIRTDRGNWLDHSYPPYFYSVMSVFVTDDLETSIVLMRSFNALLYVGVLTALFFLLPRRMRPLVVWTSAISVVPLGMFLIASVNPSGWAVLSATGLWLAMWGYFTQSGARKWMLAGLSLLLLLLGAGARADSAVYGAFAVIVAAVLAFRRDRRFALDLLLPAGLLVVAVLLFFSGGQSDIVAGDTAVEDRPLALSSLIFVNAKLLPQLWAGVFGLWGLGWLDTTMPGIVWITTLTVFVALCFIGLRAGDWRKRLALAGAAAALVVVPMYILIHDAVIVGSYVQPRYIYPLIIIFGGVALVGFTRAGLGLNRLQFVVVGAGLVIANSIALHVNLRRYISGLDVQNLNLNWPLEWWWNTPITPMIVWAAGSLAFAVVIALLVWIVWDQRPAPVEAAAQPSDSSVG